MNDTKTTMTPSNDIADTIKTAEVEIDENIDAANKKLADFIEEQEAILDKKYASIDAKLKENNERIARLKESMAKNDKDLAELQASMREQDEAIARIEKNIDENWKKLREKANSH